MIIIIMNKKFRTQSCKSCQLKILQFDDEVVVVHGEFCCSGLTTPNWILDSCITSTHTQNNIGFRNPFIFPSHRSLVHFIFCYSLLNNVNLS